MSLGKNRLLTLSLTASLILLTACSGPEDSPESGEGAVTLTYPETVMGNQTDIYHGVEVADPYRWLEDDVRESDQVRAWVDAQNVVTHSYLETIPERATINARLTTLWDYEKILTPVKEGGRYFIRRNDGLQNQYVLYATDSLEGDWQVVIDPNTWSEDGTIALAGTAISPDARYMAYAIQDGGSDWRTWRVLDLTNGQLLDDELVWLKFTFTAWDHESKGFYYSRYPVPAEGEEFQSLNINQKVYYHRVGTAQSDDQLIYERPDNPEWGFFSEVSEDGRYLVITITHGTANRYQIVWKDLSQEGSEFQTLFDEFENDWRLVSNLGSVFYFQTDRNAPNARLVAIDLENPAEENWLEIIAEDSSVLNGVTYVGGRFITEYLVDVKSEIRVFERDGTFVTNVALPGIGSAGGFDGHGDDAETFYSFSSYNEPSAIYRYDVSTGESSLWRRPELSFDPNDYVVEQVFLSSKDGTRVPMFITRRKDVELGNAPTLLYGYGGFNISLEPRFSTSRLGWMEMGGIYAVANLRGGSEYGENWHLAGTKLQKQNVFDDFIAAAEYLIAEGYTTADNLAVMGGSNGGLLVGAVINQRPELFRAAVPQVGVMDMLRYHLFTAGRFWVDDYGSSDNEEEFHALYAFSPYHNLKDGVDYPATIVTTADTDDRVVPGHSFKYAARLQAAHAGPDPVIIRIESRAGHGAGTPTAKTIELYSDLWGFLLANMDMELPEGYGDE